MRCFRNNSRPMVGNTPLLPMDRVDSYFWKHRKEEAERVRLRREAKRNEV